MTTTVRIPPRLDFDLDVLHHVREPLTLALGGRRDAGIAQIQPLNDLVQFGWRIGDHQSLNLRVAAWP